MRYAYRNMFKVNGIIEMNGFVSLTIVIIQPGKESGEHILKVCLKQQIMILKIEDLKEMFTSQLVSL